MPNKLVVNFANRKAVKVNKWKVEVGQTVYHGRALLLYEEEENGKLAKLKSKCVGTVVSLMVKEGEILNPGDPVLEVEEGCSHPTVINDLCAECGADLQKEGVSESNATVPMVHHIPQLKVSQQEAQILGKADTERLLKDRKLVLLVDLDQTIIHTTHDNIPNNIKDVHHFQLGTSAWYHTRLRPNTSHFLKEMSQYFELHICTFGVRPYAHMVASILDRDQSLFSNRILSRDECFNFNSKVANLQALFPNGDELVCIIDDRKDVWNNSPNLIPVKPYTFFTNTGDINDPNLPPAVKHSDFFAKGVKVTKREMDGDTKENESEVFDVEDEDDYLLYLETILKRVHELFYNVYDKNVPGQPEVKWILEQLRGNVLKGCEIVFSGLVPLHEGLEHSEPYLMATDLGAKIGKNVSASTTHIVAARVGTAKLHESKKYSNIKIVNPHWLTTCLYRWEQVDERLFPLIISKEEKKVKDKVAIALSLDDVLSMQQEVQAEFNTDSSDDIDKIDAGTASNCNELHGTELKTEGIQNQSIQNGNINLLTNPQINNEEKPVDTDYDQLNDDKKLLEIVKTPSILKHTKLSLNKQVIATGEKLNEPDGGIIVKNAEMIKSAPSILKHNFRVSNDIANVNSVVKKDKVKPVILDFLKHANVNTESLKKFTIPKKVRIEETPQIRIIDDDQVGVIVEPKMSPKRKKRKIAQNKPSTSTAGLQSGIGNTLCSDVNIKETSHFDSYLRNMNGEYLMRFQASQEEFQLKMQRANDEHCSLMKRLNDEAQQTLKNVTEKHNLTMQNLYDEHKMRMSHHQEEHMIKMRYMTDEHSMKIKHMHEEQEIKIKLLLDHQCNNIPKENVNKSA